MASLFARRMPASRVASFSIGKSWAQIHTWSGAVSRTVAQAKPGVSASAYIEHVEKLMPKIEEICEGKWGQGKGVVSLATFGSVPRPSSLIGMNVWENMETINSVLPKAASVYAELADYVDPSAERIMDLNEAEFIDYGGFQPANKFQPAVMVMGEFPVKPGTREEMKKLLAKDNLMADLKAKDFGLAFQILVYPTETSMFSVTLFKDFDDYARFRSDAKQKELAAWYKESGFLDLVTGPPIGRTAFPDTMVLVK